jgi:hypothetical protein
VLDEFKWFSVCLKNERSTDHAHTPGTLLSPYLPSCLRRHTTLCSGDSSWAIIIQIFLRKTVKKLKTCW